MCVIYKSANNQITTISRAITYIYTEWPKSQVPLFGFLWFYRFTICVQVTCFYSHAVDIKKRPNLHPVSPRLGSEISAIVIVGVRKAREHREFGKLPLYILLNIRQLHSFLPLLHRLASTVGVYVLRDPIKTIVDPRLIESDAILSDGEIVYRIRLHDTEWVKLYGIYRTVIPNTRFRYWNFSIFLPVCLYEIWFLSHSV